MESHTRCTHTSVTLYGKSYKMYTHLCYFVWKSHRMYTHLCYFVWKSHRMYTHLCYFVWEVTQDVHTPLLLCMGSHSGCTHTSKTLYGKSLRMYTHLCYFVWKSHRMYKHLCYFVCEVPKDVHTPL